MKSQRLIITGLLLAILILSSSPAFKLGIAQLSLDGKLLFSEDFESYDVGSFPSAGGWELVWDGRGPSYQIVTDQYAHSGIKSLQLWGQDWWSAVAQRKFTSESAIIGFQASLLIESYSAKPTGSPIAARVMFWNKELAAWGKYYARIDFTYDGNITTNNINAPIFGTWTPKTWINVRLVLDRSTNKFDVWINDVLMGNDISVPEESQDTYNINAIAIFSDHAGVKVYFDDITVFESPSEFKFEYWLPWSDSTWYNPSDIASIIGFWILEDGTTIEIDTNHDGAIDASLTGNSGEYLEWGYATAFHQIVDGLNVFPPIGTLIRSNKPIAINYRFTSPDYGIYDDHTYAYSLIPSFLHGTDYYILTDSTLASILSTANNNRIFIDENNDGVPEQEITLNYGENYIYHNTKAGAHIYSDKPIAIVVVNWDPSFDTETYAYELYPTNMLSSEYSCPHPNPGIQYYQYLTDKCKVVIGSIYDQTSINIDEDRDGIPEFSQSLAKGQCYVYANPKAEARIYGNKEFYALYIFDAYARDPWAGVYRDYMYAYIIPPRPLSGKTFLMLDHYESYHVVFTSVNIFILEDGTEVYVDRGFDGTIDETYQGNKGNVINIVSKLPHNITKITANKPVTAAYSWEGGWAGVSEAVWGFTLIPLDLLLPKIRAQIVLYSISSGEFKPGDQISAQVTVKNIGEEPWTFYVGFSVQDPNGKWWDAPYKAITLNPNEEGTVTLYWIVPSEAPDGYYNARVAVWGGKEDDKLVNLLDYRDEFNVFEVVKPVVIEVKPDIFHYTFENSYLIKQYYVLSLIGKLTDSYGNPIINADIDVDDPLKQTHTTIRTDENGRFTYQVYANKIGKFDFIFKYKGTAVTCSLIVYKEVKKVACIQCVFPDLKPSTPWEDWQESFWTKIKGIQRYYLKQSYYALFIIFELINNDNWVVLEKSFKDYGSPKPDALSVWSTVLNDAIAVASKKLYFDETKYDGTLVIMFFEDIKRHLRSFTNPERTRAMVESMSPDLNLEITDTAGYGVWAHELGHMLLKAEDYYIEYNLLLFITTWPYTRGVRPGCAGELKDWCLMGGGEIYNPPSPISSVVKVKVGWLKEETLHYYGEYGVKMLSELNYGDSVFRWDAKYGYYYLIEGRQPPDGVEKIGLEYFSLKREKGIVLYQYNGINGKWYVIPNNKNDYTLATLLPGALTSSGRSYVDVPSNINFTAIEKDGSLYIKISEFHPPPQTLVVCLLDAGWGALKKFIFPSSTLNNLTFDIDLKCISDRGFVGMDYATGEYVMGIDGAYASGNIPGAGIEWIAIPAGINAQFVVDPTPAAEYCRYYNITLPEKVNATFLVQYYDKSGNLSISELVNTTISLEKPTIFHIPASLEIKPDVLNLKSKGKWITCYIELPEGFNVHNINTSTILLNNTIPIDVKAPVEIGDYDNDTIIDLMVKFNRTAVSEFILSKGVKCGNITLTVSGRLCDGTEFMGSDTIRVKMPGDINMDGKVDMKDIVVVAKAFGTFPGRARWNPIADENEDGVIDVFDIALVAKNFGKTYT